MLSKHPIFNCINKSILKWVVWGVSEPLYVVLNPNRRGSPLKKKFQSKSTKHLWLSLLSPAIWRYLNLSGCLLLSLFRSISGYLRLSQAISGYLRLSQAILGYLRLSVAISGYFYQISSIRVQVEAGEGKILIFETFLLFFY